MNAEIFKYLDSRIGEAFREARSRPDPEPPGRESGESGAAASRNGGAGTQPLPPEDLGLNPRQRKLLPEILRRGEITRGEYEALAGNVSSRTSVYDLQDLVKKGVLERKGRGPSTRYRVAGSGRGGR